jgi:hypothetical protein
MHVNRLKWKFPLLYINQGDAFIGLVDSNEQLLDVCIQIKEEALEGYWFTDGKNRCNISNKGVFDNYFIDDPMFIQLYILANPDKDSKHEEYNKFILQNTIANE